MKRTMKNIIDKLNTEKEVNSQQLAEVMKYSIF